MTITYWVPTTGNAPTPLPVTLGGTGGTTTATGLANLGMAGPLNEVIPSDMTWQAWTADPGTANAASGALTAGSVYLAEFFLRSPATLTNVVLFVVTAGATLTAGQNFAGVYDSSGTQRAVTADQTTNWGSTGLVTAAFTSAFSAPAGRFYVAVVSNGTTPPSFRASGASTALANAGLAAANLRYAINATAQTSLPASITLSSSTGTAASTFTAGLT